MGAKDLTEEEMEALKLTTKYLKIKLPYLLESFIQKYSTFSAIDGDGNLTKILLTQFKNDKPFQLRLSSTSNLKDSQILLANSPANDDNRVLNVNVPEEIDERWVVLMDIIRYNSSLKKEKQEEKMTLTESIINFVTAYNDEEQYEFMIYGEDIINKILQTVERSAHRSLIPRRILIFIVGILSAILRSATTENDLKKLQTMMQSFEVVRIVIKLFLLDTKYPTEYLNEIAVLGCLLLQGRNNVRLDHHRS